MVPHNGGVEILISVYMTSLSLSLIPRQMCYVIAYVKKVKPTPSGLVERKIHNVRNLSVWNTQHL